MRHFIINQFQVPLLALLVALTASGCDGTGPPAGEESTVVDEIKVPPMTEEHGEPFPLGKLELAKLTFEIVTLGQVEAGKENALEVHGVGISKTDFAKLNLYLWVEDEEGTQLSPSSKGNLQGSHSHFHVTPRAGRGDPHRVVLRVRTSGVDELGKLPLSGHGHLHEKGPHLGVFATFSGSRGTSGHLELKLHDDKGDLELWLAKDKAIRAPFDLPLESTVEIEFIDVNGRKVTLEPRNQVLNEDEDGKPNIREGKTHYFIYPVREGQDASWLKGADFSSIVIVKFIAAGEAMESEEFVLKPHSH